MDSVHYLLDLAVLLFSAKVFGIAAKKLGAPEVVGQIAAGLLLGPAVFGFVTETDFLAQMAEIGVMMLMFEAGLETDLKKMRQTGLKATVIAFAGVAVFPAVRTSGFFACLGMICLPAFLAQLRMVCHGISAAFAAAWIPLASASARIISMRSWVYSISVSS